MLSIHIPVVEIINLLMRLRNNRPFMYISQIFMLSLVALSAIGHAGEWVKGLEAWMPGCTIPKWGCYQGAPLTLLEYIYQLGGSKSLLFLPVFDLCEALLLLFMPARTYLALFLLVFMTFFIQLFGLDPVPYTNTLSGSGYWLSQVSLLFLVLLSFPLILDEQIHLAPNWNYRKYLPGYMIS